MSTKEDLQNQTSVLDETGRTVRNTYISYLSVAAYLALTVESTTHLQLLNPEIKISLPIIGVQLPVFGFYLVAPIILFFFHVYFLLHVSQYAGYLTLFAERSGKKLDELEAVGFPSMFKTVFIQNKFVVDGVTFYVMSLIIFLSFFTIVPIILLRTQLKFLPYHSPFLTGLHQILFLLSLFFAAFYTIRILRLMQEDQSKSWLIWLINCIKSCFPPQANYKTWKGLKRVYLLFVYSLSALFFNVVLSWLSLFVFVIPTTNEECFKDYQRPMVEWVSRVIFNKSFPDNTSCLKISDAVSRKLNLREKKLALQPSDTLIAAYIDKDGNKNEEKLFKEIGILSLRERDLRFADFYGADLRKADMRNAQLQGAGLVWAQLQGAILEEVQLQGADLRKANLQGAKLERANLQGADLQWANLQGANLREANFQGTNLREAQFQGAVLYKTEFQGANLSSAGLQGVTLFEAQLQGANLFDTQLQGASLPQAQLQGAGLSSAQLQGADLRSAQLQGASLPQAQLQGTNLNEANLMGAFMEEVNLQGARLAYADLRGAQLTYTDLQGANLYAAHLEGANFYRTLFENASFMGANLGPLEFEEDELDSIIKMMPDKKIIRESFAEQMRKRLGMLTSINVNSQSKILHSFPEDEQTQFKDLKSQSSDENEEMRKKIYQRLLCEYPILIKQNLENLDEYSGPEASLPVTPHEVKEYALKHCPGDLPEKHRKSKSTPQKDHPSTTSG